MINPHFNNITQENEQDLIKDVVEETIQIHGFDVYYIPRIHISTDLIFGETPASKFKHAYVIEAYLETYMRDEGEGAILSKFGLEQRDSINLVIAKRRFHQEITEAQPEYIRPLEGDIIYIPFMKKGFFEIKFVEDRDPFYQLGERYTYKLKTELFRYSSEEISSDVQEISGLSEKRNTGSVDAEPYAHNDTFESEADGIESTDDHGNTGVDRGWGVLDFDEQSPFGDV